MVNNFTTCFITSPWFVLFNVGLEEVIPEELVREVVLEVVMEGVVVDIEGVEVADVEEEEESLANIPSNQFCQKGLRRNSLLFSMDWDNKYTKSCKTFN